MTTHKELVRQLAEEMAAKFSPVVQSDLHEKNSAWNIIAERNVQMFMNAAEISIKFGAKMFEEGYIKGAKDFGYTVCEFDPDVNIEKEKRGLIAGKEGEDEE